MSTPQHVALPPAIADPREIARMSWHQRNRYRARLYAWLDQQMVSESRQHALLRDVIAGLDRACQEHDRQVQAEQTAARWPCGTRAAYYRHLSAGEPPCKACTVHDPHRQEAA